MPGDLPLLLVPVIIALLIIWLIYRIKKQLQLLLRNEIYNNLPSIKNSIDSFEQRLNYLKTQVELLENKIQELTGKTDRQ